MYKEYSIIVYEKIIMIIDHIKYYFVIEYLEFLMS